MKNFDPGNADQVGRALEGFGVNLLVRDVSKTEQFLVSVLDFELITSSRDYALLSLAGQLYQLHPDHTYSRNPLPSLIPESGPRGGGVELRLFNVDPDTAEKKALEYGYEVLMSSADKPHGLRECFLLDPDGYCWVPSVAKSEVSNDH